jgi:hypothetical protein
MRTDESGVMDLLSLQRVNGLLRLIHQAMNAPLSRHPPRCWCLFSR